MNTRNSAPRHALKRLNAAMTLIEVLISAAIGMGVLVPTLTLTLVVAKEQRRELVTANLQQQANTLEDKIHRLVRSMSASEAIAFAEPVAAGSPFYRAIVVAEGASPVPRQRFAYNTNELSCMLTPDTAAPSSKIAYFRPTSMATLRSMYFYMSQKNDGAPDASSVNVVFNLDDNGACSKGATNYVSRIFTVAMRNN